MKRAAHARYKRVGGAVPPPPPLPPAEVPIVEPAGHTPAATAAVSVPAPDGFGLENLRPHNDAPFHVEPEPEPEPEGLRVPEDWVLGQLLNVRGGGNGYRVTLLGEEYDPRRPERCLEFSNSFECQHFVSNWYARKSWDPRA